MCAGIAGVAAAATAAAYTDIRTVIFCICKYEITFKSACYMYCSVPERPASYTKDFEGEIALVN